MFDGENDWISGILTSKSTFQDIKGKSAHLNTKPVLLYDEMVMLSKVDLNLNLPESARPETKEFWNRRI